VADVAQQFSQGNISVTSNPLDVAISGEGFFRMNQDGVGTTYTRNGQFNLDKDGYLVTNTGENVTGYTQLTLDAAFKVVGTSGLGNIQIDLDGINAEPTESMALNVNLNSSAVPPASLTPPVAVFSPSVANSYNFSTSVTVYDSLGSEHSIQYFFRKEVADPVGPPVVADNTWTVYAYMDGIAAGDQLDLDTATLGVNPHTMIFSSTGSLNTGLSTTNAPVTPSGAAPLVIAMDFTGSTQYSGGSGINSVSQDGYQSGNLVGLSDDSWVATAETGRRPGAIR
jgi:flagellar hook protein FlgE